MPDKADGSTTADIRAYYEGLEIEGGHPTFWVSTFDGFHWICNGHFAAKLPADDEWEVGPPRRVKGWPETARKFFARLEGAAAIAEVVVPKFAPPKPEKEPCRSCCGGGDCTCPACRQPDDDLGRGLSVRLVRRWRLRSGGHVPGGRRLGYRRGLGAGRERRSPWRRIAPR